MKKLLFTFFAVLMATTALFAGAFDKGGVTGVGGRALGMGDAFTAVSDDGSCVDWNTAGLVQLERSELNLFVGPLLNGKEYYTFLSFGSPFFQDTAWQLSVISLIHNDKNMTKEFTVLGSFASTLNLERTFSVGVSVKYLNYNSTATYTTGQTTLHGIANGLGLDLGLLYQVPLPLWGKKFNLGLFIQDVDTTLQWEGGLTDEQIPTDVRLGAAYYVEDNLIVSTDLEFFQDLNIAGQPLSEPLYDADNNTITSLTPSELRVHVGVEGWFFKRHLGLRGGYTAFATMPGEFTGGVSYKEDTWEVDYAYIGHAEHLGDSHRFSVILRFGQERSKMRAVSITRPPKNLTGYPANDAVNLTWEPTDDPNVTGYSVYLSKTQGSRYEPVIKRVKENYITITGLKNGTRYYFVVAAINNTYPPVESPYSNEASVVPAPVVPGTPDIFPIAKRTSVESNGAIGVKWGRMPSKNLAGYNLYITGTSGKGYVKVNPVPINDVGYVIKGLEVGKKYFYVITSVSKDIPPIESKFSRESTDIARPESTLGGSNTAPAAAPARNTGVNRTPKRVR
jgi:hypothetical protein